MPTMIDGGVRFRHLAALVAQLSRCVLVLVVHLLFVLPDLAQDVVARTMSMAANIVCNRLQVHAITNTATRLINGIQF